MSHFFLIKKTSQRKLKWTWNGDFIPADRLELEGIRKQLETERFPDPKGKKEFISFYELPQSDQNSKLKSRLKDYSKKVYKVTHQEVEEERESIICMRENPFYVDTVRAFRDRRYIYKDKLKQAQREYERVSKENKSEFSIQEASKMIILYDSLQLAHKCILNSFYGYVMRRGARWYSMETAGAGFFFFLNNTVFLKIFFLVTYTGAKIITQSREIIEKIGVPLELDTDGIWCILPQCFPQNFKFLSTDPKRPK